MPAQSDTTKRLFFALWPDVAVRDALALTTRASVLASGGAPVPTANLHLTLAFLHNVDVRRIDCILDAAARTRAQCVPFTLDIDRLGYWPRSRILFAAPTGPRQALDALVRQLWASLGDCEFTPEWRPFEPHVTLARRADAPAVRDLPSPVTWEVRGFALIESITGRRVASYEPLASWTLARPGASPDRAVPPET